MAKAHLSRCYSFDDSGCAAMLSQLAFGLKCSSAMCVLSSQSVTLHLPIPCSHLACLAFLIGQDSNVKTVHLWSSCLFKSFVALGHTSSGNVCFASLSACQHGSCGYQTMQPPPHLPSCVHEKLEPQTPHPQANLHHHWLLEAGLVFESLSSFRSGARCFNVHVGLQAQEKIV